MGIKLNRDFYNKVAIFLFLVIAFLYAIIQARVFLYPLAFAGLFTYLLYPIVNFLEKKKVNRIFAILISIILAIAILGLIFYFFYSQLHLLLENFDAIKAKAENNIESFQNTIEEWLGLKNRRIEIFLKNQLDSVGGNTLGKVFTATTGTVGRILLLPVLTFLFLYYRTKFAYFILKSTPKHYQFTTIRILKDIASVVAHYMGGVSIVVLILCILNSTGLLIIGVKYAVFFGIISAFLNYIPYFGTLMGGAIPFLFVLLTYDDPFRTGLKVAILFVIVQFIENNILTPNIVGGHVNINPFFIIVGLIAGAMVWGIPGMLVVVPFLASVRILASHIDNLKPLAFLLGPKGTGRHHLHVIERIKRMRKKIK